jgi:hypothetical protein
MKLPCIFPQTSDAISAHVQPFFVPLQHTSSLNLLMTNQNQIYPENQHPGKCNFILKR